MKLWVCSLVVVLLFVTCSYGLGTLYINQVVGNLVLDSGFKRVRIERTVWDDATLYCDFVYEEETIGTGGGEGSSIEDTVFKDGSVSIPINLHVTQIGTADGRIHFNGGFRADAGTGSPDYSFFVENDTGNTDIRGLLYQNDNINADNGRFYVADPTGETTILGLTRPNGGIDVNNQKFEVLPDFGDYYTIGSLTVEKDIVLGTEFGTNNGIYRQISFGLNAGNTFIQGQSAGVSGGNLVLVPGFGAGGEATVANGGVLFGNDQPDKLILSRVDATGAAGKTIFFGQDSGGVGGDLYLEAGRGEVGFGGGNVVLVPGTTDSGANGDILLGAADISGNAKSSATLRLTRTHLYSGENGGITYLIGQDVQVSDVRAGDLTLKAGSGSGFGNIFLLPGVASQAGTSGDIVLGNTLGLEFQISRIPVTDGTNGGNTYFEAQNSDNFEGGDFYIIAGAGGQDGSTIYPGGNIFLDVPQNGIIYWGNADSDLEVVIPFSNANGHKLSLLGQDALGDTAAGAFTLKAGNSPTAASSQGGSLTLLGGEGINAGGSIEISGGVGIPDGLTIGNGGDISLVAGSSGTNAGDGGSVYIKGGSGLLPGNVYIETGNALNTDKTVSIRKFKELFIERTDFFYVQPADGSNFLTIDGTFSGGLYKTTINTVNPDANGYLSHEIPSVANPFLRIRSRYTATFISYVTKNPTEDIIGYTQAILDDYLVLFNGLYNHHVLFTTI